ncbi:MAG: hypothetical protein BWY74_00609 [Firmicutes bacterium ADurb.Bin419]|nr:MAG: hypothetical protein BWY74_00609 [Firmicutes bacterium ADurb.Bin419]
MFFRYEIAAEVYAGLFWGDFMNNIRRVFLILISSLFTIIFTSCSKNEVVVNNSISEIKGGIETFIGRDCNNEIEIELMSTRNIENLKIVAFTSLKQGNGYAILENISKDAYKICSASFYKVGKELPVLETYNGKYNLSVNSNHDIDIKYILPNNKRFLSGLKSLICP